MFIIPTMCMQIAYQNELASKAKKDNPLDKFYALPSSIFGIMNEYLGSDKAFKAIQQLAGYCSQLDKGYWESSLLVKTGRGHDTVYFPKQSKKLPEATRIMIQTFIGMNPKSEKLAGLTICLRDGEVVIDPPISRKKLSSGCTFNPLVILNEIQECQGHLNRLAGKIYEVSFIIFENVLVRIPHGNREEIRANSKICITRENFEMADCFVTLTMKEDIDFYVLRRSLVHFKLKAPSKNQEKIKGSSISDPGLNWDVNSGELSSLSSEKLSNNLLDARYSSVRIIEVPNYASFSKEVFKGQ